MKERADGPKVALSKVPTLVREDGACYPQFDQRNSAVEPLTGGPREADKEQQWR
jgi:hypothetical protein